MLPTSAIVTTFIPRYVKSCQTRGPWVLWCPASAEETCETRDPPPSYVSHMRDIARAPCLLAVACVFMDTISIYYSFTIPETACSAFVKLHRGFSVVILAATIALFVLLIIPQDLSLSHILVFAFAIAFWLSQVIGSVLHQVLSKSAPAACQSFQGEPDRPLQEEASKLTSSNFASSSSSDEAAQPLSF